MIGMDTPETVDPRKPVQCFGLEASAQAKTILGGQSVYLETDPSQDTVDKYGRTLAYVWTTSGRLFNLDMIANGYAHEYTYYVPYRYQQEFKANKSDARTQERGLWSPNAGAANADVYYKNCAEARAAGVTPIHKGEPGYRPGLDRDGDGIACE
jgi:micrococcal nuclease